MPGYLDVNYYELFQGSKPVDNPLNSGDIQEFTPFARGAEVTSDHASLRRDSALCPQNNTAFTTDFDYNEFIIESELEIYISSCHMAVKDK